MDVSTTDATPPDARTSWFQRVIGWCGRLVVRFLAVIAGLWCMLALYYSNLPAPLRPWAVVVFVAVSAALLFWMKPRWRGVVIFFCLSVAIFIYWLSIPPSNNRQWRRDVAVLTTAKVNGNQVTLHNVRNFEYKTATNFIVRQYDRTYDLDKLRSVDFIMSFWAPIPFAHTMVSFEFEGGNYVCFSIETRPEADEGYSPIGGSFKQFELVYVVADERDVIRLRTNVRDEAVYLYHLVTTPEAKRRFFLRYCSRLNELNARPEWYCTLTRNCTTDIPRRDGTVYGWFPESWKIIINSFVPEFLHAQGSLDQSLPLPELKKLGHVNTRAQNADQDSEFSKRIREGIPELK